MRTILFIALVATIILAGCGGGGVSITQAPLGDQLENQAEVGVEIRDADEGMIQIVATLGAEACGTDGDGRSLSDSADCDRWELLEDEWCSEDCTGTCESDYLYGTYGTQYATSEAQRDEAIAHCQGDGDGGAPDEPVPEDPAPGDDPPLSPQENCETNGGQWCSDTDECISPQDACPVCDDACQCQNDGGTWCSQCDSCNNEGISCLNYCNLE